MFSHFFMPDRLYALCFCYQIVVMYYVQCVRLFTIYSEEGLGPKDANSIGRNQTTRQTVSVSSCRYLSLCRSIRPVTQFHGLDEFFA